MIRFRFKHDFGGGKFQRVTVADFSLGTQQMFHLGLVAIGSIKHRTAKVVGSDDAPMPPLSQEYSAVKVKGRFVRRQPPYALEKQAAGLNPIRDLRGPGGRYRQITIGGRPILKRTAKAAGSHMIDDVRVTYADSHTAKIDITTRRPREGPRQ